MSEDKKSLTDLVPDSVDNAVKNITDKPTQNIGTTIADIWYLVFGGISQAAEKRKLKYFYALQEFESELKEKISKIPEDKLIEPDIQIIAQTLHASKYCIEKEALREMFSNLICSSLNEAVAKNVHPSFVDIICQLTSLDAKILKNIYKYQKDSLLTIEIENELYLLSLSALESKGLIYTNIKSSFFMGSKKIPSITFLPPMGPVVSAIDIINKRIGMKLTPLGKSFCITCIIDE